MDLQTATERAKAASLKTQRTYYIIIDSEGECDVSTTPLGGVTHKFVNGAEDKNFVPHASDKAKKKTDKAVAEKTTAPKSENKVSKSSNKNVMAKKAKKSAKKVAAKKAAPAKEVKLAKGQQLMAVSAIRAAVKDGKKRALNHAGKVLTPGYLENMGDQERKMVVTIEKRGE